MANEIALSVSLRGAKGGTGVSQETTSFNADMAGDQFYKSNPSWSTTGAAIDVGTVDTANDFWLTIYNTDATNYVELSLDGGTNYKLRVPPGKKCLYFVKGGTSVYRKAITAACVVEVCAAEA